MTATTARKVWREWRGWPGSETWRPCEAVLQRCSMRGPRPCWLAGGPAGPPECQVCPALAHLRIAGGRCEGRGPAAGQGRAAPDQGMHMHTQHSSKASCPLLELAAAPRGRGWAPLCLPAAAAISASSRAAATATEPSGRQAGRLLPLPPALPPGPPPARRPHLGNKQEVICSSSGSGRQGESTLSGLHTAVHWWLEGSACWDELIS